MSAVEDVGEELRALQLESGTASGSNRIQES